MTTIIFLVGWICGAATVALLRYALGVPAQHVPAAERLLTGERYPLALNHFEGD